MAFAGAGSANQYGGGEQVEAGRPEEQVLEGAVAHLAAPTERGATSAGSSLLKRCVLWCSKLFLVIRRRPGL